MSHTSIQHPYHTTSPTTVDVFEDYQQRQTAREEGVSVLQLNEATQYHNWPKRFSLLIDHRLAVFIDQIHVHERVIHVYHGQGWKPQLNNLRLLLQPFICTCLLLPWLHLIPLPQLHDGLHELAALMNTVRSLVTT